MRRSICGLLVVGGLVTAIASADEFKDEAIKQDRQRIAGRWQIVALEVDGNKSMKEDVRKLTVVNATDGRWSLRSEGKEVSKGTSTLDPTTKPKTIDFTPTDGGGNGIKYLGIYELGENARKLCFVPSKYGRPTEFSSKSGSQNILVTFQRIEAE
jgi:uncharacterized protein (TIGR03067 family)